MKLYTLALSALLFLPLAPATAQVTTSPGDASKRVYNWCMKRPDAMPTECACSAGFYAGVLDDDAFRILTRMLEQASPDGGIDDADALNAAIIEEAIGQLISSARIDQILKDLGALEQLSAKSDSICMPLRSSTKARTNQ